MKHVLHIAAVALIGITIMAFQPSPEPATGGDKVTVCHFDDHNGDFVTNNWITNANGTPECTNSGGNAIVIGAKACEKGHKAEERYFACSEGDLQVR